MIMRILATTILLTIISLSTFGQCLITQLDIFISACNSSTNDYTVTGDVDFINAPATGQLIIIDVFSGAFETFYSASPTFEQFVSSIKWENN